MAQAAAFHKKTVTVPIIRSAILGSICLIVLGGILVAGLWPFNPRPLNKVKWLTHENGLEFRRAGTIFTEEPINVPRSNVEQITLDVWLQPAADTTAPILAFFKIRPREQFRLLQYGDSLLLQKQGGLDVAEFEIEHSLNIRQSTFFTITADKEQTSVYVNGTLTKTSSHFNLSSGNLSGRLVVGAQPFDYDSWGGQLRGLAIYHRRLTAAQALAHYESWISTKASARAAADLEDAVVLYQFDEHQGQLVHSLVASGPDLLIPQAFTVLEKRFLDLPAPAISDQAYLQDVAINVIGFIPLGFCFCAFLHIGKIWPRVSTPLAVVVFGAAVSLTIEILQFYLPTRDSSLTDVITNTLGTAIGVGLYYLASRQLVARLKSS
jgi:VanZ family protein